MRLVVDAAASLQGGSATRGVGRYVRGLIGGLARTCGSNELIVAIRYDGGEEFAAYVKRITEFAPGARVVGYLTYKHVKFSQHSLEWNRRSSELVREYFLEALAPDFVLVGNVFEGFDDNVTTSIKTLNSNVKYATIVHDLIPLLNKNIYLSDPNLKLWYFEKLENLMRSDIYFSVSNSACRELIKYCAVDQRRVQTVYASSDELSTDRAAPLEGDAVRPFAKGEAPYFMYAATYEPRKNFPRLLEAFSIFSRRYNRPCRLILVTSNSEEVLRAIHHYADRYRIPRSDIFITGYISDQELFSLYADSIALVYASTHEGFGLPLLEAMTCGAAVVSSNVTSMPEIVVDKRFMFDPTKPREIADVMLRLISDSNFRAQAIRNSQLQRQRFSWEVSAAKVWSRLNAELKGPWHKTAPNYQELIEKLSAVPLSASGPSTQSIKNLAAIIEANSEIIGKFTAGSFFD